jgi:cell division protein FtsL
MSRKRVKRVKITKGEKLLYACAIFALGGTFLLKIFCSASIGNLNIIVEKLKADVSTQAKKNESLTMQVNELTSFDYVNNVVKNMGLAYNNDNIIIIDE